MRFTTVRLVYKNMVQDRPKLGLWGLIACALFSTTNLYFNLLRFGQPTAIGISVWALLMWFVALPMVFTLIDIKNNPKRVDRVLATITKR